LEYYSKNLTEVLATECEKAEFGTIVSAMRKHYKTVPYGKLIFAYSNISSPYEYFARLSEDRPSFIKAPQQHVPTQEMATFDLTGRQSDLLAKLWYLPHMTEALIVQTTNT
jgi:hypothetical protein